MVNIQKHCLALIILTLFTNTTLATDEKLSPGSGSEISEQDETLI